MENLNSFLLTLGTNSLLHILILYVIIFTLTFLLIKKSIEIKQLRILKTYQTKDENIYDESFLTVFKNDIYNNKEVTHEIICLGLSDFKNVKKEYGNDIYSHRNDQGTPNLRTAPGFNFWHSSIFV